MITKCGSWCLRGNEGSTYWLFEKVAKKKKICLTFKEKCGMLNLSEQSGEKTCVTL